MSTNKLYLIEVISYLVIFILPVILYLKYKDNIKPFIYLKLNNISISNILKGILFCAVYIIILIVKNKLKVGHPINLNIGMLWVAALLVGVFEEIPFRGFILQKLCEKQKFWIANFFTTLLFVTIHLPKWHIIGADMLSSIITVSIASLVFGYLFKEYDTLWIPIMCHSVFDLTAFVGLR